PHVVVVHTRQIVVDEGVRVDHLQRGRNRQRPLLVPARRGRGRKGQGAPQALAPAQRAVAHGPVNGLGKPVVRGQKASQGFLHRRPPAGQPRRDGGRLLPSVPPLSQYPPTLPVSRAPPRPRAPPAATRLRLPSAPGSWSRLHPGAGNKAWPCAPLLQRGRGRPEGARPRLPAAGRFPPGGRKPPRRCTLRPRPRFPGTRLPENRCPTSPPWGCPDPCSCALSAGLPLADRVPCQRPSRCPPVKTAGAPAGPSSSPSTRQARAPAHSRTRPRSPTAVSSARRSTAPSCSRWQIAYPRARVSRGLRAFSLPAAASSRAR